MPAPAGSEPGGFEMGPEVWLLALGVMATLVVLLVFAWLVRLMIKEDRDTRAREAAESDNLEEPDR